MPIHSKIDRNKRRVHATCTGIITADDLTKYQAECWIYGDTSGYDGVFDATQGDFSSIEFSSLVDFSKKSATIDLHAPPSKLALTVLPGKQQLVEFYLAILKLMPDRNVRESRIFDTLDKVLSWVDGP